MAVAGTPPAVLQALQRDIAAALASPEVRSRATLTGFEITPSTPQALHERIQADVALYAPLISEGRIAPM
jgi:tripartite-type tricarboxylate transporter receptor subunit TctC